MAGAALTGGEVEVCGTEVKVSVDGFLRSVFSRNGVEMAQIVFPSENGFAGFRAVVVPRYLVRVPAAQPGTLI